MVWPHIVRLSQWWREDIWFVQVISTCLRVAYRKGGGSVTLWYTLHSQFLPEPICKPFDIKRTVISLWVLWQMFVVLKNLTTQERFFPRWFYFGLVWWFTVIKCEELKLCSIAHFFCKICTTWHLRIWFRLCRCSTLRHLHKYPRFKAYELKQFWVLKIV